MIKSLMHGCGLAALLCSAAAGARVQQFHATWEQSSWKVETTSQHCALVHDIPRFGRARFEQRSGHRLQFSIAVDQPPVRDHLAQVHSEAPPWQHQEAVRPLGEFKLQQGKTPLRVPREQALRIYYELEQGMQPVLEFADWGDGKDQVQVALMPVRFREALPAFLECTAGLLYLDFEPISEKTVFFQTDSDRLSFTARKLLDDLARQARKQSDIRIVLGGHADVRGSDDYNLDLSRRRANMVTRFLRSRGVPGKLIETRVFGESQPADPDNNARAWARNRRVTLWLAEK
jgi:outer membrane protein OmpA-like peptidoglycan-associated protein